MREKHHLNPTMRGGITMQAGDGGDGPKNDTDLNDQIRYLRDRLQWLDGRFGWSSAVAISALLIAKVNVHPMSMPSVVHHDLDYALYATSLSVCIVLAAASLGFCGLGMSEGFAPWRGRSRQLLGCTTFLWSKNVARYSSADQFVEALRNGAGFGSVEQQCSEVWRLSRMIDDREVFLFSSRSCAFLACIMLAFSIWTLIGFYPHVTWPHLTL